MEWIVAEACRPREKHVVGILQAMVPLSVLDSGSKEARLRLFWVVLANCCFLDLPGLLDL